MKPKALERELQKKLRRIAYKEAEKMRVEMSEIGFELREPCAACPFRSDIEPYYFQLIEMALVDLAEGNAMFTCHETDPRSDYKGPRRPGGIQHCAGAAIFVENSGQRSLLRTAVIGTAG
jgi:hypothetical protein